MDSHSNSTEIQQKNLRLQSNLNLVTHQRDELLRCNHKMYLLIEEHGPTLAGRHKLRKHCSDAIERNGGGK